MASKFRNVIFGDGKIGEQMETELYIYINQTLLFQKLSKDLNSFLTRWGINIGILHSQNP